MDDIFFLFELIDLTYVSESKNNYSLKEAMADRDKLVSKYPPQELISYKNKLTNFLKRNFFNKDLRKTLLTLKIGQTDIEGWTVINENTNEIIDSKDVEWFTDITIIDKEIDKIKNFIHTLYTDKMFIKNTVLNDFGNYLLNSLKEAYSKKEDNCKRFLDNIVYKHYILVYKEYDEEELNPDIITIYLKPILEYKYLTKKL